MKAPGRRRWATIGVIVGFACASAAVAPASYASGDAYDWWYDRYGIAEIQAEGWTGEGVTIAVIDDQIDPSLDVFADADIVIDSEVLCRGSADVTAPYSGEGHGSEVTALIVGNGRGPGAVRGIAPRASIQFYGIGDGCANASVDNPDLSAVAAGIQRAVEDGADIVTTSFTSTNESGDAEVIAEALAAGVVLLDATPNGRDFEANLGVWRYNGVISVGSFAEDGALQEDGANPGSPNVWPEVTVVAPGVLFPSLDGDNLMQGTSYATPLVAGALAVVAQKYPDATGNQLIQSLIHNTTAEDHEIARDTVNGYGYGPMSLRHMLREDPTLLPDENPLMDKSLGEPSMEQLDAAIAALNPSSPSAKPSASAGESSEPSAAPSSEAEVSAGPDTTLVVWIVVGIVGVLAIAVVIVLLVSRQRRGRMNGEQR